MYTFNEKGHRHLWDGKPMTGVTTILGVIAKPALIAWSANMACDYISEHWLINQAYSQTEIIEMLNEARKAHTKKKEAAGDIGKLVHSACELWVKENKEPELDEQGMKMFNNFRKWVDDNKVKILESEKHLYSEELFVGGIVDIIAEIDGQKWICDIKTGGVYAEAIAQMGAYDILLEKMGHKDKIAGYIILGLLKDGTFVEKRTVSIEDGRKMFMAAYEIYKIKQIIENQIL